MIPIRLRLSGFLSYQEPVELDFTSFHVACISGSNGAGKSSLLDAMVWALFGKARRTDDAIINSSKAVKAAEVVFDFNYEGNLYRIQRSKQREKTTILELLICDDSKTWRPLTEKSVRETENRIQTILRMDYDTFTNASFLLQGKADQFAQQRPADRKKVLSAILGLEVWEEYQVAASDRRKNHEADLRGIDAQLEEIESELAQEPGRKLRLAEVEARLDTLSKMRKKSEDVLASLQRQVAILAEQRRMVEVLEKTAHEARLEYDRFRNNLEVLNSERLGYQQVITNEHQVRTRYQNWQNLRAELEKWETIAANFREIEARRSTPLTAIATEASRLEMERQTLEDKEKIILQDQLRLPGLESMQAEIVQHISILEKELGKRNELDSKLQASLTSAADARAENSTLKEAMRVLKERIDRLNQVAGAVCPLCGQPLQPEERLALIANLESEGKEMGSRFRANLDLVTASESEIRELQAKISGLSRLEEEYHSLVRQQDRIESDRLRIVDQSQAWYSGESVRLREVNRMLENDDFAYEARSILAEIDKVSKSLGYDSATHDSVRREEMVARSSESELRELESALASMAPLIRQINGLEKQIVENESKLSSQDQMYREALNRYEVEVSQLPDVNQAEQDVFTHQSEENRLRMEVGMVRQSVAVLDTQRERKMRLKNQRDSCSQNIARLKTLERAFSKDGVPALLIEQALPEIETHANEILDRLSNGNMSIRFATQRQYKDKSREDRKETLDIVISDSSGEREYELFSGGEAFRVNFSIRLALSRVLAQRAGARLQTLVIDEGFGSQDIDGRQRLIEAINLVQPEFAKILVITHLEELKEAFPARIEVEKTVHGSRVMVLA